MEIWNHLAFDHSSNPQLTRYVLENDIKHDLHDTTCVLDISESDPHWNELEELLKSANIFFISETKFSKDEMRSAEWLTVRSKWYYDYPQPETGYIDITYKSELLCTNRYCGMEKEQKDSFRFKKTPKWGKRNFCMTNWVHDELFLSPRAKELMEDSDLQGMVFLPVNNKSGQDILEDIFQMQIPYILPEGIADQTSCISDIYECPVCGKTKARPTGRGQFVFYKSAFVNTPDFVKSAEWFGAGASASRLIFVSQKAYRFITENKLDSSLVFEPILLV